MFPISGHGMGMVTVRQVLSLVRTDATVGKSRYRPDISNTRPRSGSSFIILISDEVFFSASSLFFVLAL